MRNIVTILFLLSLFSCASNSNFEKTVFFDSKGKHYNSTTAGREIKKEYDLYEAPKLILLATSNSNLENFKLQLEIIHKIDAEQYQYLYILANSKTIDESGYYTSKTEAESILKNKEFKILIYNKNGDLVLSSSSPLEKEAILNHLTKSSSGR